MASWFVNGGPVMYVLAICSIVGMYVSIYKWLFLKVHYVPSEHILMPIKEQLMSIGKEETFKQLRTKRNVMLRVLASAIKLSENPRSELQDGIKETLYPEIPKLEKFLPVLSSIITVAPILGLMGTVLGLMDIFNVISGGGIGDAQALSGGIAKALITTVSGLGIAIPFIFVYQYLSHRVHMFILQLEQMTYEVVTFCQTNEAVKP